MNENINLVVNYIDDHYHEDITNKKIEELTAESIETFENRFEER